VAGLKADADIAERVRIERLFTGGASAMMPPGGMSGPPPGMMPGMMPGMAPGSMPGMAPGMPGFGGPGMQPAVEQLIPREVCRRAAWRLVALADAVLSADGQKGLVLLPGADSAEARALSGKLRRGGLELDATPDDERIKQALEELRPPPPPSEEEAEEMADEKPEPSGDEPAEGDVKPAPADPAAQAPAAQPAAGKAVKAPAGKAPAAAEPPADAPQAPAKPAKPAAKPAAGKP